MARLALVFVAIHLTTPSVSQSPGLVAIHRQETLVSRLSGSKRLYHWHVQITGHGLVGTGVAVVKGELFSPARIFFRCDRGIHVFICSVAESTRLRAGLEGTPPHSARIIAVSKIAVRDGTGGRGLRNRWARCALLDWLCRTWSRYVHSGIAGAVDEADGWPLKAEWAIRFLHWLAAKLPLPTSPSMFFSSSKLFSYTYITVSAQRGFRTREVVIARSPFGRKIMLQRLKSEAGHSVTLVQLHWRNGLQSALQCLHWIRAVPRDA